MPLWRPASIPGSSITMRRAMCGLLLSRRCRHCRAAAAKDKLRVGCIGAGGFARGIIFPHLRSSAGLMLESVATSTGAAAASARTGFGFTIAESPSELLANPNVDAVFILTRHNSHAAYVKSALERGKCVFVEKPLAINREQLEMVRTAYAKSLGGKPIAFSHGGIQSPLLAPYGKAEETSSPAAASPCWCISAAMPGLFLEAVGFRTRRMAAESLVSCVISSIGRELLSAAPCRRFTAAASAGRGTLQPRQRHGHHLASRTAPWRICCTLPMEIERLRRNISRYSAEAVSRASMISRALYLSRNGKTETLKGKRDKGHRREMELTIEAMKQGKDAADPIRGTNRGDRGNVRCRGSDQDAKDGVFAF